MQSVSLGLNFGKDRGSGGSSTGNFGQCPPKEVQK